MHNFFFLFHLMLYPQSPHLCMHTHVHPWAHVSFPYSIGKTAYLVSFGPGLHEVWVNGSTISRFCRVLPCQWSSPTCRQSEPPQTDSIQWAVIYLSTLLFFSLPSVYFRAGSFELDSGAQLLEVEGSHETWVENKIQRIQRGGLKKCRTYEGAYSGAYATECCL